MSLGQLPLLVGGVVAALLVGRALKRGASLRWILSGFAILTAGPFEGRSPGDPYFDPFWARCQEARLNVVYHIGRTSLPELYNTGWGLRPHPPSHRHSLMEYALSFTERPVVDSITALVADNVFGHGAVGRDLAAGQEGLQRALGRVSLQVGL